VDNSAVLDVKSPMHLSLYASTPRALDYRDWRRDADGSTVRYRTMARRIVSRTLDAAIGVWRRGLLCGATLVVVTPPRSSSSVQNSPPVLQACETRRMTIGVNGPSYLRRLRAPAKTIATQSKIHGQAHRVRGLSRVCECAGSCCDGQVLKVVGVW